jgi:hypothetical protein
MNELHIARKIRQVLDLGVERIDSRRLERLRISRERALLVQKQHAPQGGFARVGDALAQYSDAYSMSRIWLPLAALVVGLAMIFQWQSMQPTMTVAEAEEIDAALLTSELPINAYLDRGFDAWLKRSSP